MSQTYTRKLLYSLADRLGRKRQDMDKFIKTLEDNWFDTRESLASLSPQEYQKFAIPERLIQLITEQVGSRSRQEQQPMEIEMSVDDCLKTLSRKLKEDMFLEKVGLLGKLFTNIRENLIDEKYKTLKKTNARIADLAQYRELVAILKHGGFQEVSPGFVMKKVNIGIIDECIDGIARYAPQNKFNPYESHISSIGDTNVKSYQGESSIVYNEKLAQLEAERNKLMSKPIKDREIKVFQIEPNETGKYDQQFNEEKEFNNEDEKLYMENMKMILKKQGEDVKFMNRRKQEYFDLVKKPCFSQTLVRVKLHDNWIFECKFAPLETMQTLVDIFDSCLEQRVDYYLYMTPPVQKLSGVILRKTFDELGCVPRAIFYFKCEQTLKGNIFKIKKSGKLFGIF